MPRKSGIELPEELFPGTQILSITEVPLNSPMPQNQIHYYQVEMDNTLPDREKVEAFLSSSQWLVEKPGKKAGSLDLRALIRELSLGSETNRSLTATWTLEPGPEGEIRPEVVLRSIFNLSDSVIHGLNVVKSFVV